MPTPGMLTAKHHTSGREKTMKNGISAMAWRAGPDLLDTWPLAHPAQPYAPTAGLLPMDWLANPACYEFLFVSANLAAGSMGGRRSRRLQSLVGSAGVEGEPNIWRLISFVSRLLRMRPTPCFPRGPNVTGFVFDMVEPCLAWVRNLLFILGKGLTCQRQVDIADQSRHLSFLIAEVELSVIRDSNHVRFISV